MRDLKGRKKHKQGGHCEMAKILRIILAVSATLFVGACLFYGLISGASAATEGKLQNYVIICALISIWVAASPWGYWWCLARKDRSLKEQEKLNELLMKQNEELSIKYENEILRKQRDKLDK